MPRSVLGGEACGCGGAGAWAAGGEKRRSARLGPKVLTTGFRAVGGLSQPGA